MSGTRYHTSPPTLGDVLKGSLRGRHMVRTGVKVRRNSVDVNDERARRYVLPIHDEEVAAYLQAAERYNLEHKEDGKYVGPFRGRGMDVLRWLLREARANAGVCSPSHLQIAEALKLGLRTVSRIMKALFLSGFLEWQRRSKKVDADDGGVRQEQTSNLYPFNVPQAVAGLVSRLVGQRAKRAAGPIRGMRVVGPAELSTRQMVWDQSIGRGGRLAGVLQRLALAVDHVAKPAKLAVS